MARIAVVNKERCNPAGCDGYLCIKLCPVNRTGKECIIKDAEKIRIDEKLCIGCSICSNRCPFEAISIINLPETLSKEPIHRYGENGFALYSLPTPIFGKVVGIIGKNGIGKSTAIKIIAGILKPNLGRKGHEAEFKEIMQFYKGTEAQSFFEKIHNKKITVSYKPQQVGLLPKAVKGKVIDLLKGVDEKKELNKIAELLELKEVLHNDLSEVSGGELQRIAIAATVLKKANLYIFDEPTSYLDVKQRIKISKFIKSLADEKTAVLVVEHDLIVLDYIADLVHLMYGKEACFGIVSGIKTNRAGINTYLEGFLKEENIRFRDSEIKFEIKPPIDTKKDIELVGWEKLHKKLGKFSLEAQKGHLAKKTVTGILGENGVGKTSFVKILAGVIEQDKGEINKKIKVSYKPQYIDTASDELVMSVLSKAVQNYEVQLIRPLELKHLLNKKIKELSGGELQRVAIAYCLSQEADLYLLDEPSAYLDVEQRLIASKVIQSIVDSRGASALVVDHDLLFMDYLSEKLIVFEGIPAKQGIVQGPFSMKDGMNQFLKGLAITLRRDPDSHRPRVNKEGSVKDREQKSGGKYYYA